jgi:diguanylate cyclase (GGDEF)-like protein
VILCPGIAWEGAHILAERVRAVVEQHPFANREKQPSGAVTVSVGIAGYPHDGASAQDVLKAADDALYNSKRTGRNRVSAASVLTLGQSTAAGKKAA